MNGGALGAEYDFSMEPGPRDPKRKCCLNCHFLARRTPHTTKGFQDNSFTNAIRDQLWRREMRLNDFGQAVCSRDVWHGDPSIYDPINAAADHEMIGRERGETCFYFEHVEGMDIAPAEILERRAADRREAERDRDLTRQALGRSATLNRLTIAALFVAAACSLLTIGWYAWARTHPYHEPAAFQPSR